MINKNLNNCGGRASAQPRPDVGSLGTVVEYMPPKGLRTRAGATKRAMRNIFRKGEFPLLVADSPRQAPLLPYIHKNYQDSQGSNGRMDFRVTP